MPRPSDVAYFNRELVLEGDVAAIAFSGLGQWLLKGIAAGEWPGREASAACRVPPTAAYAIDTSAMADYAVRPNYERYGAAIFFDSERRPVGVWIEADGQLVAPPTEGESGGGERAEAWGYALWRAKVSMYHLCFAPLHLINCHWIVSNSLCIAVREQLDPSHAVRRLADS